MNKNGFHIHRGTNISHLFVDEHLPRGDRRAYFNERDISQIARFGFDHIRIPIIEKRLWDETGNPHTDAFSYLNHIISVSIHAGLRVILCFHELRSHEFSTMGVITPKLFIDPNEIEIFCEKWSELSDRFVDYPTNSLAYELLNEPLAPADEDWNKVLKRVYAKIRTREAERTLIIGSNFFQRPEKIKRLWLPANDPNIIKSFHFYYPELFTHYKTTWSSMGKYDGPISYPGRPVPKEFEHKLETLGLHPKITNQPITRLLIKKLLRDAIGNAQQSIHPVHCGEFGCSKEIPKNLLELWYRDIVECMEEEGIAWTQWDWKGNFGLLDKDTWLPSGIHSAMGLKSPKRGFPKIPGSTLKEKLRYRVSRASAKYPPMQSLFRSIKRIIRNDSSKK